MPYQKNGKRDYETEYEKYHSRPEQIKNRTKRNKARAEMEKERGDLTGKDVGHKNPLIKGGSNDPNNLRVETVHHNRSVAKTKNNKMKGKG